MTLAEFELPRKVYELFFDTKADFDASDWSDTMDYRDTRNEDGKHSVVIYATEDEIKEWGYANYRHVMIEA